MEFGPLLGRHSSVRFSKTNRIGDGKRTELGVIIILGQAVSQSKTMWLVLGVDLVQSSQLF